MNEPKLSAIPKENPADKIFLKIDFRFTCSGWRPGMILTPFLENTETKEQISLGLRIYLRKANVIKVYRN